MKEINLNHGYKAIVDDEDYDKLSIYKWFIRKGKRGTIYVERWGSKENPHIHMHREIMQPLESEQIDHINGDGLDNRKCNLRKCLQSQNQANAHIKINNSSGYKGVTWHKATSKWAAQIQINNKRKHLGLYNDPKQAAKAYDIAALKYFGEFALTNKELLGEDYSDER